MRAMRLHQLVGGSNGPGYSLFRSHELEKIKLAKTKHLSSGISAACVYVWWSLIRSELVIPSLILWCPLFRKASPGSKPWRWWLSAAGTGWSSWWWSRWVGREVGSPLCRTGARSTTLAGWPSACSSTGRPRFHPEGLPLGHRSSCSRCSRFCSRLKNIVFSLLVS